jgi:hypothetical protein
MDQLILTRDDGEEYQMFEGKHVVVLHSESPEYREWTVSINQTKYCIVNKGEEWTLMSFVPERNAWVEAPGDVDSFLKANHLILAA